ncbi:MAG: ATP-binding cassette domain-containing protein [Actinomycetes bacterium]
MGHVDISHVTYSLPDGRVLLLDVSFRVGDGAVAALIGANGAGKSTLMRLISGDADLQEGSIVRTGGMGVMRQFIGHMTDGTVRDLLLTVAPPAIAQVAARIDASEAAMMHDDSEPNQMAYAQAISDWSDVGGYELEVLWDVCTMASLQLPFERAQHRAASTLSGGEQKRLVLEALLRGSDEVLLLDEPDNYLDVPGKRWLEQQLNETKKTVLFVSHDRELLSQSAKTIITVELGVAGNSVWIHGGGFASYGEARKERFSRLEELRRRWDEEHQKIKDLVQMYAVKAKFNDGLASRLQAARTRLRMFEEAGPPQAIPIEQNVTMRLKGGRTGKRAVVCDGLELTGLVAPFNSEIWFGERIGVLGANGSGKSHFLRLLAAGGSDPEVEHLPVSEITIAPVKHSGLAKLGARIRPGWFAQTHHHPELLGRTLLDILHRGDEHRDGMQREQAARALDRYGLAHASEQKFESLSGGQQARFQILMLELSGATLLLLDEPTDNLDLESAEALETALNAFEGTVLAVTHDRWFAKSFDRFLIFGSDATVTESDEPIWDVVRAAR